MDNTITLEGIVALIAVIVTLISVLVSVFTLAVSARRDTVKELQEMLDKLQAALTRAEEDLRRARDENDALRKLLLERDEQVSALQARVESYELIVDRLQARLPKRL